MKNKSLLLSLLLFLFSFATSWAAIGGSGTLSNPYTINSTSDWNTFANNVGGGTTYEGKYVKLAADISVTTMVGTSSNKFKGVFDGGGHTLTVNYDVTEAYVAPFRYVDGATIMNLHVAGTIKTSNQFAGGLMAEIYGNSSIINCWSSVTITSSRNGDGTHGGFMAYAKGGNLTIINSLFDGKLLTTNSTNNSGGFVGWCETRDGARLTVANSLFAPSEVSSGMGEKTISRFRTGYTDPTIENTYYTTTFGAAQGTLTSATGDELVALLGVGWEVKDGKVVPVFEAKNLSLSGTGTSSDPYTINSTRDWNTFANNVNCGTTYEGKYVKLTADISVTTMVGTSSNKFKGVFDGDGHTLTVNYDVTEAYVAPFRYVDGATVKNLHVAGTIKTTNQFAGGLMASIYGDCAIINCWSSVTITSSRDGDGTHGGFIGVARGSSSVSFNNCRFDGQLLGSHTNSSGGFAGWHDGDGSMTFDNSLFAPSASITIGTDNSATFSRNGVTHINNSYYTTAFGTAQGTQTSATGDELAALLGSGWEVKDGKVVPVTDVKNLATATISGLQTRYVYTGSVIPISYTVTTSNGTMLSENIHYTASISPSTVQEPGVYTLTITAKDGSGYTGSQTRTFQVVPAVGLLLDDDYIYPELGYIYVNMPNTGTKTVTLTDAVTSFKVYDDGGKKGNYSERCNGYLTLAAPTGYVLRLTGSITTDYPYHYLTVYNSATADENKILLDKVVSTSSGTTTEVDAVVSSGNAMTLYFHSDTYGLLYAGLDLTVTLLSVQDLQNAKVNLQNYPWNNGNTIDLVYTVTDANGTPLTKGTHYNTETIRNAQNVEVNNLTEIGTYTLTITAKDGGGYTGSKTKAFSVIPPIPDGLSVDEDYLYPEPGLFYVNMPVTGSKTVSLTNDAVTSFKVYDDGGKDGNYSNNCDGYLTLTAPTGYALRLSGDMVGYTDYLTVYNGAYDVETKILLDKVSKRAAINAVSTDNAMTLYFHSDDSGNYAGLDLTVTLLSVQNLQNANVNLQKQYPWNYGNAIDLGYTVTAANGIPLTKGVHYTETIRNADNIVVGAATVQGNHTLTITAIDGSGYSGSQTLDFTVIPATPAGLSIDADYDYPADERYYVNMPTTGSKTVTITEDDEISTFKVYDDGGKNDDYSSDCDGTLTIVAPQGYVLWLTGTAQVNGTSHTYDYLSVYDGLEATDSKHLGNERYGYEMLSVRNFTSVSIGEDVGLLASSSNSMTLYFHSGHYDSVSRTKGLDLTVRIVRKNDIKNALVTGMRDRMMWNYGSPIDLGYSVANASDIPLTEGTDYTATIRDDEGHVVTELKELGAYTLTLEGLGDYTGVKTIHFTVIDDIPINSWTYTLEDGLRYKATGNVNYPNISSGNFYVYGDVVLNVAEGATLTVNERILLKDGSNLTINLAEGATFNANKGISVTSGNSLTINGSGTLNATGTTYNAGIGGTSVPNPSGPDEINIERSQSSTHGHIIINGGTINAQGGWDAAGIGGGNNSLTDENSIIEINGGVVNATAGVRGSGIGGGYHEIDGSQGGIIIIRGGQVTARKNEDKRWPTFGIGNGYGGPYGYGADGSGTSLTIGLTNVGDFIDVDGYKVGSTSLATTRGVSLDGTKFVALPGESHFCDGDGTPENPYRVYSDADWGTLGLLTHMGSEGKHVKQFADFSTSQRIGSVDAPFKGIYDGNGHTLTVNYETAENYDSPFRSVMNATIAFLHVTGTIQSGHQKIGGLVGYLQGNSNKIENCWSSVTINSKYGGEGYVSGFVGGMWMNDRLTIRNCRFDGKLLDGSGSDTDGSGFVAYKYNYTDASVQNCLFIPAELEDGETWIGYDDDKKSRDFAYTYTTVQNCYYTRTYNANKGSAAVGSMTSAELATALGSGWTVSDGKVVPTTSYKNLDVCSFDNVENFYEYTGSPIAIDYEVKDNLGRTLVKGTDYTEVFSSSSIQGMGEYTLTVTGKGDYTGSLSKTFNVFYNLPGSGTSKDPYLIESANDWDCFGDNIANEVPGYDGAYYKLVNDISVTTMVGSADRPFRGSFDGNGKTLTVTYGTADSHLVEDYIAPFRRTDRATIKNLHVAGNIYTDGKFTGGLVAELKGDAIFNSCWSSVVITSGKSGDGSHGGFIGVARGSSTVAFHNCRFDGQLLGSSTNSSGGFVGWHEGSVKFGNSLFAPSATVTIGTDNSATFSRNGVTGVYNCYYTAAFGDVQGTAAGSKTEAQLAAALGAGWELKNGKAVPVIGYRPTAPEGMDVDDLFIENEVGYYYVNMPTQGSKELTLDISLKSFKVYDEGGKTGDYGDNRDRSLIFTIPEGYKLRWSGSISTHGNDDYLVFYDITNSPVQLSDELYGNLTFHSLEYNYNVRKIMQYFHTEGSYSEAGGFDFTVEVLDAVTQWPIEIASVTGGTMESNVNESLEGETIFLTDHPEDGYLLNSFTVTDAAGEEVPFTGGKIWYDGTLKTFYMPGSKVTVTPAFIHAVTAEDGLAIDLPESGIVDATIPSAVKSFKVNYKHAVYDATTNLRLTAPEGYVLKLSGNVSAQVDNASSISYVVYDGEYWEAPQLITERAYTGSFNKDYMGVVSSGKSMFVTISSLSRGYGVDWDAELKIELVKADTYHDITVSNTITHGKVAIDKNSALLGEVVTVNVTPDEGFVLEKISVTDDNGDILLTPENPDVTWGDFSYYTSNEFTFKMRISDAKVNATFISKADFYVNMPKTGQLDITIDSEDAISSFHVYDNSGVNGYYVSNDYGKLLITAPEGYVMSVSGYVKLYKTSNDEDYLDIYDGNSTAATKLGRFKNTVRNGYYDDNLNYHDTPTTPVAATSRGNQLLLHFVTNNSGYVSSNGGVYLTVTLKGISIAAIPDQTYTGSAICPAASVTDGENPLELGVDYTIKCTNNVSAGTAQMTVTGIGGYTGFGPITKSFKIIPKEITVAWSEQISFVYNGTEQAPTATAEGLLNGDKCTIAVSGATVAGKHTATATDLSNGNYKLPTENLEKEFTIAKASLMVTAKNKTIAYGDEPANGGVEYAGFVGEESASVLGGTLAYEYNYVKGNATGEYSITPSGLTADNYEIEFVAGKLTVEPKEISIAWGEQTLFVYNGLEQVPTAIAEGVVDGDDCTITVSGAAKDVGTYTATATVVCSDDCKHHYKLPTENLEKPFEITQREITISWGEQTSFVYNGSEQAPTATAEGLLNGDDCSIRVSGAAKEVGTYTATATVVCNDNNKHNYKLSTENLEKTFVVTPKEISIVWGEQTLFYNGTEQAPTATAEGLVNGDDCSITVSGAAKEVGTYTATATVVCNDDCKHNYKLPTENLEINFEITKSNLAVLKSDLVVQDGEMLTGTLTGNYQISIADGATVTLDGVTIIGDNNSSYKWAGITCQGDCNIILAENSQNTVMGFYEEYPGIYVPDGKTLAISGTGSLDASSNGKAAGIGGGYYGDVGNIEISGGTITATGGAYAAGIGGGAGIVKGSVGKVGSISISGGTVTATGGLYAAGIGGGSSGSIKNISISGDKSLVTAIKGKGAPYSVGNGKDGSREGTITIGGIESPGIETSPFVYPSYVTNLATLKNNLVVQDGDVLRGSLAGNYQISIADGATVTLNGVTINGTNSSSYKWSGITCLGDCNIILAENSSNIVKGFYEKYSGIYVPEGKTLTISGTGSLDASSNGEAAGIGGGYDGDAGNIVISGGTITATGGAYAAGIGGGTGKVKGRIGSVGSITISGDNTKVTAIKGEDAPYSIGKSAFGSRNGKITIGGIETSDIETSTGTFKYPYLMLVYEDGNGKHAVLNGEYSGEESVNITEDIENVAVTFDREFAPNSGHATIMFPFDVKASSLTGVRSVIEFDGVKTDKNDNKMVGMRYVWCNATLGEQEELNKHPNCNKYSGELKAYTPYMIEMDSPTLGIKDAVTLKSNSGKIVGDAPVGNWVFRGTLQKKEWPKGTGIINEGRLWAFSAAERSGAKIGEFVQFGGNNWANPFRAYLVECKKSGEDSWDCQDDSEPKASQVARYRFADALAPTDSAATDEPLVMRQAAASETASLNSMDIVIVYGDKDSDQERPTVIGHFNPATGEIRMLPRTKQTYDLKGRKVGNGKKAKGAYYRR